jgi:hypothetical protein
MAKSRKRSETDISTAATPTPGSPAPPASQPSAPFEPERDRVEADDYRRRVERRAYELYLSRGGAHGSDWEDWLAAERELIATGADDDRSKS